MRNTTFIACAALTTSIVLAADPVVPPFADATGDAGLTFTHFTIVAPDQQAEKHLMTPGVVIADFDRDGTLDLYVSGGLGQAARLFLNEGDGTFVDRAAAWGVQQILAEGACAAAGDVDGDGDLDLYAGRFDGVNELYMNDAGTGFTATGVASGAVLADGLPFDAYGATFGDVEGDGDLDLVTVDWTLRGNRLFINDGAGVFEDVTGDTALFDPAPVWGFTPALADMDGDGATDLVVAADFGTSQYYAGLGAGSFGRLTGVNGTCTDENGMGSALGDYDGDGDLDWFVTSIFDDDGVREGNWGMTGNRLYRNDGKHQYTDVTDEAGVRAGDWGWGAQFGDLNHDGRPDLAMTNGFTVPVVGSPDPTFEDDPTRVWLHAGGGGAFTYTEAAAAAGVVHTGQGRGLVMFDAENDGDLDIVITTNQAPLAFFRNGFDPAPDRWIAIDLVAPPGNAPDGIGATIALTVAGATQHRFVHGAPSFMSQGPLRAHFGFPAATVIDRIDVLWPDGTTTVRPGVAPGRVLRLRVADIDADGRVDLRDLLAVLASWGPCGPTCPGDVDRNGVVGVGDLVGLLAAWD